MRSRHFIAAAWGRDSFDFVDPHGFYYLLRVPLVRLIFDAVWPPSYDSVEHSDLSLMAAAWSQKVGFDVELSFKLGV